MCGPANTTSTQAVERCDHASALKCLRTRLQPLCAADRAEQLHQLAACLFCTDLSEIQRVVEWPGTGAEARQSALKQIQVRQLHACAQAGPAPAANPKPIPPHPSPDRRRSCRRS